MKKILLSLMLVLCSAGAIAQKKSVEVLNGRYSLFGIENVDSVSSMELFNRAISWISNTYKYPDKVISSKDKDAGILVLNGIAKSSNITNGFELRLSFKFKDGRYKWEINDLYFPYNALLNMNKRPIERAPRYSKFDDKSKETLLEDLKEYIDSFVIGIKSDDNW